MELFIPFYEDLLDKSYEYYSSDVSKYALFIDDVKNLIILKAHSKYSIEELNRLIDSLGVEKEISDLLKEFAKTAQKKWVNPKDKNSLVKFWYEHYIDYGVKNDQKHTPDLITFQFQIDELEKLISRLNITEEKASNYINTIKDSLLNHQYTNFDDLFVDFVRELKITFDIKQYKNLGVMGFKRGLDAIKYNYKADSPYGDFGKGKGGKAIQFISGVRSIILGGSYTTQMPKRTTGKYIPFFMNNKSVISKMESYFEIRFKKVLEENYRTLVQPKKFPEHLKEAEKYVNIPKVEFRVFDVIDWCFSPDGNMFYDGLTYPNPPKSLNYIIQLHPISAFYCFFHKEIFGIFIDQLIHHEFAHIMQMMYLHIYENIITNTEFAQNHPLLYKTITAIADKQWLKEEIPDEEKKHFPTLRSYFDAYGGHTENFVKEMNKFKNCAKAMKVRGRIETLYASFYYKNWGKTTKKGHWVLCDATKESAQEIEKPKFIGM